MAERIGGRTRRATARASVLAQKRRHSLGLGIGRFFADASGEIIGQIATVADITELKQTEEALKARQGLLRNLIEVQENEKQRLCCEFHDGLIQYAVGTTMSLEAYQRDHSSSEGSEIIESAIRNLKGNRRRPADDSRHPSGRTRRFEP